MVKEVSYRKIIGCPKHGTIMGERVILKTKKYGIETKKPAFRCDKCKKVYLEPSNGTMGDTKQKISGFSIWNTVGPYPLKEKIYVFDKETKTGFCDCKGTIKEKTKAITHFLLASGKTEPANGAKVCLNCGKVFASEGLIKTKEDFLNVNEVQICNISNEFLDNEKETVNLNTNSNKNLVDLEPDWENEVFEMEDVLETSNLDGLLPASRVASAYYDAKISYNPYQYLPWLKVFVNGSKRLLISDEVGLGKTIEAGILIMEQLTENVNAKIIILCPAFLREKWYQELYEKFFLDSQIYDGKTEIDSMTNIVILPISRIKQYLEKETKFDFSMVVIDEIHYFKNSKSVRYGYLRKLLEQIKDPIRIFMSATPINNSGNDYHSIEELFQAKPDRTNTTKKQAYIFARTIY